MRWITKPEPPELKLGDTRLVRRVALLPHEAKDGYTYWLETTWIRQTVVEVYPGDLHYGV